MFKQNSPYVYDTAVWLGARDGTGARSPKRVRYTQLKDSRLEWRNWQTHGTQNPAFFTEHVGSTPTSSTTDKVAARGVWLHRLLATLSWVFLPAW